MDELKVFKDVSNHCEITKEQLKQLDNYIKVFLIPHTANKWTRAFAAADLKETAENLLGFEIGMRNFLDAMYYNNFALRPASNLAIIGYYKVKANYYDLASTLHKQLKKHGLKIEIKKE